MIEIKFHYVGTQGRKTIFAAEVHSNRYTGALELAHIGMFVNIECPGSEWKFMRSTTAGGDDHNVISYYEVSIDPWQWSNKGAEK